MLTTADYKATQLLPNTDTLQSKVIWKCYQANQMSQDTYLYLMESKVFSFQYCIFFFYIGLHNIENLFLWQYWQILQKSKDKVKNFNDHGHF